MITERSLPFHSFGQELIDRVLELFSKMDQQTAQFRMTTGLHCPPGCGQCCESTIPRVTVIEMLPAAEELFSRSEVKLWLERIDSIGENQRCVFYQPDLMVSGNGRCQFYRLRPSICRLFPFAAMRNKDGVPELLTCHRQRELMMDLMHKAQQAVLRGLSVPNVDSFLLQMFVLQPSIVREKFPINQALRLALERYGLWIQYQEANRDNHLNRGSTKGVFLTFSTFSC